MTNSERPKLQLVSERSNFPKVFITAYGPKRKAPIFFPSTEGRTKQSFRDECDINVIMRRYEQTGVLDHVQQRKPIYGDVTGYDYQRAMDLVADARTAFEELPARIRDRFNNDPGELLDFVTDEANLEEADELGLLSAEASKRLKDAAAARTKAESGQPAPAGGAQAAQGAAAPSSGAPGAGAAGSGSPTQQKS